ncbi:MAG TPA: TIGR03643 family protein [Methylophilaceae bacterium]|nr:TIGR03643 family protein [Methylophilaceae bacterium]
MSNKKIRLSKDDLSRLIEMAWEDKTPFEAILNSYDVDESELMKLMQANLKPSSYRLWRKRVKERSSKHLKLRSPEINRAYCITQYKINR